MEIICLDLEGVLVPEIWPAFAAKTGIKEFELTTRNIPDYDELMRMRIDLLNKNKLKLNDITGVIKSLKPLEGAQEFVLWLKQNFQLVILSDTFYQFSYGLMLQLDLPTLLCHKLIIDDQNNVVDGLSEFALEKYLLGELLATREQREILITILQCLKKQIKAFYLMRQVM